MNYLKYTPYAYLLAAAFFVYDAFAKYTDNDNSYWISLLFATIAVFVFLFRKRYAKRFEERSKQYREGNNQQ